MIACPACGVELSRRSDRLDCPQCGAAYPSVDGETTFSAADASDDYDPADFARLAAVEEQHCWFRARSRVIRTLFERHVGRAARVIEVGAGTGTVAAALADAGYRIAVADVFPAALDFCRRRGLAERYRFDLRRPPFKDEFDAVGLFDVLEHLDDDRAALAGARLMLREGGRVVLTVPARPRLWSASDVAARHKRRYRPDGLRACLEAEGFEVIALQGFFLSLVPILVLRRLLFPARGARRPGLALPVANELILGILNIEHDLLPRPGPAFGASLAAVARRR